MRAYARPAISRCTASTPICRSDSETRARDRRPLRAELRAVEREIRRVDHAERRPGRDRLPFDRSEPEQRASDLRGDDGLGRLEVAVGVRLVVPTATRSGEQHARRDDDARGGDGAMERHQRTCSPRVVR